MKKTQQFLTLSFFFAVLLVFCPTAFAKQNDFSLTIAHINDSHAHLEPAEQAFTIGGKRVKLSMGGAPRLVSAVKHLREQNKNFLFLHAGDALQGTLYTKLYKGRAEAVFLNMAELDAFEIGNHELDLGYATLLPFAHTATFPILGANIDFTSNPFLKTRVQPYIIKQFGSESVAIIGNLSSDTGEITFGSKQIKFFDEAETLKKIIQDLQQKGINKIIVLSHTGLEDDVQLAKQVEGIDVIVGGHSHTLLGKFKAFGLKSTGSDPVVVKNKGGHKTLVVQSGDNLRVLGLLSVTFDEKGNVRGFKGASTLLACPEDASQTASLKGLNMTCAEDDSLAQKKLAEYSAPLAVFKKTVVATATENLKRTENSGPGQLVVEAMLDKTRVQGAQISIMNASGVRAEIQQGKITAEKIYDVLPFANKLVTLKLKGNDLKATLENVVNRSLADNRKPPYFYTAGLKVTLDASKAQGQRITSLMILSPQGTWKEVAPNDTYKITTIDFIANGSSGYEKLKQAAFERRDIGLEDAEIFMEYLKAKGSIKNP